MSHRPLPDQRWYSTPALVRQLATFAPTVTDDTLRGQIAMISKWIDEITSQTFWPISETFIARGQGDFTVKHPSYLPIQSVSSIQYNPSRNQEEAPDFEYNLPFETDEWVDVDYAFWEVRDRAIFSAKYTFPTGLRNIRVSGVFGWLENSRGLITTTTVNDVNLGDTTFEVEDAMAFRVRDIIDLEGPDDTTPMRAIIESIDYDNNIFTIDVIQDPTTVPAGSTVSSWGQVPALLELVVAKWIQRLLLAGPGLGGAVVIPPGRIKRERTDSYEYEKYDASILEFTGDLTGDPMLDRILSQFTAPMHVGFI